MFILSLKTSKKKILFILLFIICLIIALFFVLKKDKKPVSAICEWGEYNIVVESSDDIILFLSQFNIETENKVLSCENIKIPSVWNDVYIAYNNIQKRQGLDLTEYMGQDCQKWTFKVTNYPNTECDIIATVITNGNRVIGGDISESVYQGFTKAFIDK